ncbi:8998_t:CDS:2, partial [Gigaspora margarita]
TATVEFDAAEFNTKKQEYAYSFGVAKSILKFALENELVNEFVRLIVKFIDNHSGIATNKLRREDKMEAKNEYSKTSILKVKSRYCGNCYGTGRHLFEMVLLELGHALLESPFVRDSVIFEIGTCTVRVIDGVVGIFV